MRFIVGCDFDEFKRYYNETGGNLGSAEEYWITKDASHLIIWREMKERNLWNKSKLSP